MGYSRCVLFAAFILMQVHAAGAQQLPAILLWPGGAPGDNPDGREETIRINESTGDHIISSIHKPSVIPCIPSKDTATGIAVVIAPGGAHRELWTDHEGHNVAQRLSENGIAAFILGGYQDMESVSTGMAELYLKFKKLNVPAELHIYADARHGFGIRKGDTGASSK